MTALKIGRNAPCPCGSGKKFKHCCSGRAATTIKTLTWDDQVAEMAGLALEPDKEKVDTAVHRLAELLKAPRLTSDQRNNGLFAYARALQSYGNHGAALAALDQVSISPSGPDPAKLSAWLAMQRASSLSALGRSDEACDLVTGILDEVSRFSNRERGVFLVEIGKVFAVSGNSDNARSAWEQGLKALEGNAQEIGHYAGLLANLASLRLKSGSEQAEADGLKMMAEAISLKASIGDLYGLANSYDMLGHFYMRSRRFEPAIVNFRKGLTLSRRVGDRLGLAQALNNIAGLYVHLRQPKQARFHLNEAKSLASDLNDQVLVRQFEENQKRADLAVRDLASNGEILGPKANCACGSGKEYEQCCGRADFEPIDLPWAMGGTSEDANQVFEDLQSAGIKPTRLDLFLRSVPPDHPRYAWFKVIPQDGWHEVHELPDLASIQLRSARDAAEKAIQAPDALTPPLTALILSACALEAFINQVAFFVAEVNRTDSIEVSRIPKELLSDAHTYQRNTELTQKWEVLGNALCYAQWPPSSALWDGFRRLIAMRNEFVHFKLADYEQIIPPPKQPTKASSLLPAGVKPKETEHSWAFKVLTPEMAKWAVDTADALITEFRSAYTATRKHTGSAKV